VALLGLRQRVPRAPLLGPRGPVVTGPSWVLAALLAGIWLALLIRGK
jgi:hypothetical protein